MTNTHKERLQATPIVQNHAKVACGGPLVTTSSSNNPCPIVLPIEIVGLVMTFLDGNSLLNCACVSVAWESMAQHRDIWKTICLEKWPTLQRQTLSQLPGAPDYDLIRLYGGSWKECFIQQNRKNQRAEITLSIHNFSKRDEDRIVSDSFYIGEHVFCLWIFPRGNPHEVEYAGRVLSVYLVLTDLENRSTNWLTCAVFSLQVENQKDRKKTLEWNSCLGDNRFDQGLFNWGVHSLGLLDTLLNEDEGFVQNDTLTLSAHVRIMSISFRVFLEDDFTMHHGFGLVDMTKGFPFELPFCCTISDLVSKLQDDMNLNPNQIRIWCFNQPVTSGQALRPRKLLCHQTLDSDRPMFGHVLTDGVDIDAYSFCQLYLEQIYPDDYEMDIVPESPHPGYIFVKLLNPVTYKLDYLGRIAASSSLQAKDLYEFASSKIRYEVHDLILSKEEMLPSTRAEIIPIDSESLHLHVADIVIFEIRNPVRFPILTKILKCNLQTLYQQAQQLIHKRCGGVTLNDVEELAQQLDIPKFRIRSAFRKCHQDAKKTLHYVMKGRHLGFICDSCGETDFQGARFNCTECNDYDLCAKCHGEASHSTHRYANIEGKWQRLYDFTEHSAHHQMLEILPVFYNYNK